MTKHSTGISNVFAMGKGNVEGLSGETTINTSFSNSNYINNFLSKALYRTPLNPLLSRGTVTADMADFTMASGIEATGVLVNGAISGVNSTKVITVDTVDATTKFLTGDKLYTNAGTLVGIVRSVSALEIILEEKNIVTLSNNDNLKKFFNKIVSYEIHKGDASSILGNLSSAVKGINLSNDGGSSSTVQTYTAVNRKYPNSNSGLNSVSEHLVNLENTAGNMLKVFDAMTLEGQRLLVETTTLDEAVDFTETILKVDSNTNIAVNDILVINNEEMLVTHKGETDESGSGTTTVTVIRGYNNTTAGEHSEFNSVSPDYVYVKDNIDHLWVLVNSDNSKIHHFAKIVEVLEAEVWGDAFRFEPSLKVDIPKDTKFSIFSSLDSNMPKIDSDNQTLVACAYGLTQEEVNDNRHFYNTHVSSPFFYFINGKSKLESATRYILRSSSWDGLSHSYTYSTFLTAPEYDGDIIDSGPYSMEGKLVDLLYEGDNPNFSGLQTLVGNADSHLSLVISGGATDTIVNSTPNSTTPFGSRDRVSQWNHTLDYYGKPQHTYPTYGLLRENRIVLTGTSGTSNNGTYSLVDTVNPSSGTITFDSGELQSESLGTGVEIYFTPYAWDVDKNKLYSVFDESNLLSGAFRNAHRGYRDDSEDYFGHSQGNSRFIHFVDSPLTNNLVPNALQMINHDSITSSGGYVDIVFADTQKILGKKMKIGDSIDIHQIVDNEEFNTSRIVPLSGVFNYTSSSSGNIITVTGLESNIDLRFQLGSSFKNSKTDVSSRHDPLYETFTVDLSGSLYHFTPSQIDDKVGDTQTITVKYWRAETDLTPVVTTFATANIPNFSTTAYRRRYSFLADNIMTNLMPIDSKINSYSLDYNGSAAGAVKNRNLTTFDSLITDKGALTIGKTNVELSSMSRVNDINLVLRGGTLTGHRLLVSYGDDNSKILKLQTNLKNDSLLASFNKSDYIPYINGLSTTSHYSIPTNVEHDGASSSLGRYDLNSPASVGDTHVRGVLSYLDFFDGAYDIEKRVFSGTVESIEEVVEDGMFKFKIRGRDKSSILLGPIINKNYKFTDDIVYSTTGPIERCSYLGFAMYHTGESEGDGQQGSQVNYRVYEVGKDVIHVEVQVVGSTSGNLGSPTVTKGDYLFNREGTMIGRVHAVHQKGANGLDPYLKIISLEEGTPVRIKHGEGIYVTKYGLATTLTANSNPAINEMNNIMYDPMQEGYLESQNQSVRGNTIALAKALSSNPYSSTRVNSLSGTSSKGIIFTGGNNLSRSADNAPVFNSNSLIGTSSSSHKNAKGYSIHATKGVKSDLPFYCNLTDEVTNKYGIDYKNLHTVSSLTNYEVVSVTSKDRETIMEIAPILPAIFARVDENSLDNRDNILTKTGVAIKIAKGKDWNGPITTNGTSEALQELKVGDFVFSEDSVALGKIVDISRTYTTSTVSGDLAITLDRPLSVSLSVGDGLYKYYHSEDYVSYYVGQDIDFRETEDEMAGATAGSPISYIQSNNASDVTFLKTLKEGTRIVIENSSDASHNGTWTLGKYYKGVGGTAGFAGWYIYSKRLDYDHTHFGNSSVGSGVFRNTDGETPIFKVLNNTLSQSLYFLNTQGLNQGGVLSLVNSSLSSPNKSDDLCKPIKWAGGIVQYITDTSLAQHDDNLDGTATRYNPQANNDDGGFHYIGDYADRYGNFKWRYFGLERGRHLSYINRRKSDGKIKQTYSHKKGRVSGYSKAYRIADATLGADDLAILPQGYHNNDFATGVKLYDLHHKDYVDLYEYVHTGNSRLHPYFLENSSIESRDFKSALGGNFADFTKYGTTVMGHNWINVWTYGMLSDTGWGNAGISFSMFQNPRLMPRLHDNFRGGDWQWDEQFELNPASATFDGPKKITGINFEFNFISDTKYRIHYGKQTVNSVSHEAIMDSFVGKWIQVNGMVDKNNNRTFYIESSTSLGSTSEYLKQAGGSYLPPYSDFRIVNGNESFTTGTSLTSHAIVGKESITSLYEPWIGPKVDGITRAKDYWELPDPKALRWFIFAPTDMYPDSMSRKHHIGYSGTVDGTTVSRSFTDYNIMLKATPSKKNSEVQHEYYEGVLEEELDNDDNYETLPISEATILPSEMKRFGLMRLVDCVFDWHFNLIDAEQMPDDITSLTTPNFEYTSYLPLKKTTLYAGAGSSSHDGSHTTFACLDDAGSARTPNVGFTFDAAFDTDVSTGTGTTFGSNPKIIKYEQTSNVNDRPFRIGMSVTGTGIAANSVIASVEAAGGNAELLILNNDVTQTTDSGQLTFGAGGGFGSDVVVGDQLFGYDSRYLGRVSSIDTSAKTITVANRIERPYSNLSGATVEYRGPIYTCGDGETPITSQLNWDSFYHFTTLGTFKNSGLETSSTQPMNMLQMMLTSNFHTGNSTGGGLDVSQHSVPYGAVSSSGSSLNRPITYHDFDNKPLNDNDVENDTKLGLQIDKSALTRHFNYHFSILNKSSRYGYRSGGGTIKLPPAFRTYYSSLVNEQPTASGILINHPANYAINSTLTLNVSGSANGASNVERHIQKGNTIYDSNSNLIGVVSSVDSTGGTGSVGLITLTHNNFVALNDNVELYLVPDFANGSTGSEQVLPEVDSVAKTTNALVGGMAEGIYNDVGSYGGIGRGAQGLINKSKKCIVEVTLTHNNSSVSCDASNLIKAGDRVTASSDKYGNIPLIKLSDAFYVGASSTFTGTSGDDVEEFNLANSGGNGKNFVHPSGTSSTIAYMTFYNDEAATENIVKTTYNHPSNVLEFANSQNPRVIGNKDASYWNLSEAKYGQGNPYQYAKTIVLGTYNVENSKSMNVPIGGAVIIGGENELASHTATKPKSFGAKTGIKATTVISNTNNQQGPTYTVKTVDPRLHFAPVGDSGISRSSKLYGSTDGTEANTTFLGNVLSVTWDGSAGTIKTDREMPSTYGTMDNNSIMYGSSNQLDSTQLANEKYGDGYGEFVADSFGSNLSGSYSFLGVNLSKMGGFAMFNTERIEKGFAEAYSDEKQYIAKGAYCGFSYRLHLKTQSNSQGSADPFANGYTNSLSSGRIDKNASSSNISETTINKLTNETTLRIGSPVGATNTFSSSLFMNNWLNFVDLTGFYLVPEFGYEVNSKTYSLDNGPFDGTWDFDLGNSDPNENETPKTSRGARNSFVWSNTSGKDVIANMSNTMVDPKYIHYVKEHKRNITGDFTMHEITLDNIAEDKNGNMRIVEFYRIMRPSEVCFWENSPTEINLNTLSSQTTKMPQSKDMYTYVPTLSNVNSEGEFTTRLKYTDDNNIEDFQLYDGKQTENSGIMSMYMAVDMDGRKSQYKTLGTIGATHNSSTVTGTNFLTNLQEGDVIKIDNQLCYVKTIESDISLTIVSTWRGTSANTSSFSGSGILWGNYFPVVRDTSYLFNPTGNRNTFKSGEGYTMLLTDGLSRQKNSMSVEADYWDERALCRLSFGGKFNSDMLGLVSLGEIFSVKSNVPTNIKEVDSARIGTTVTIGSEVEDVVNDLLSNENIKYEVLGDKEFPYYISPNFQGLDLLSAANFSSKFKDKYLKIETSGIKLTTRTSDLDMVDIELSYKNKDIRVIELTRSKSTFDLYNEIIVYGSGFRGVKRNRKSIDGFGKKTLEEVNMELVTQDDVDSRAKFLLSAHSKGDDRFTIKMSKKGIEFVKSGDILTLDFPEEGIIKGQYKVYEIRRELAGLIELEVGTYRKDLANRFAELLMINKSNTASIRGDTFSGSSTPIDFFDTLKLKELRLVIKRTSLQDPDAFTLGFQTLTLRKLDFGTTMGPQETSTEIITDKDLMI